MCALPIEDELVRLKERMEEAIRCYGLAVIDGDSNEMHRASNWYFDLSQEYEFVKSGGDFGHGK